jgi:squalene synthase HpnC
LLRDGAVTPRGESTLAAAAACAPEPGPGLPAPEALLLRARQENFPVASRLLPRAQRRHLMAIYGFARLVDDLGDEAPGDRSALLDELDRDLERVYAGEPRHPLMRSLAATVRALDLPREPFERLIQANRRDQCIQRYATYSELLGYCELSANPVGRLVLHVFAAATPERIALSDAVCSGLQLVEHWQDVAEDLERGRIYLPAEDLARFGCEEADLRSAPANERVRVLLRFEATRAHGLLDRGVPLVASLAGRARLAVAGFVAGGRAALDAIARCDFDVLSATPRPLRRDFARRFAGVLREARRASRWERT